jgi:hypothetical protein
MSDIKWIEGEIPKPGTCISCGSADHAGRKFMTFSKFIRNHGKVLLCSECVNSVLRLPDLDFVPRIELEMAKTEAKVYRERVEPAMAALRNIRDVFTATCDQYLESDGTLKDQTVKFFKRRSVGSPAISSTSTSNSSGSHGFFDTDPDSAA